MNICMIFNALPSGLETHPRELVENIAKLGHTVHLIVPETRLGHCSNNVKPHFVKMVGHIHPSILRAPLQAIISALYCLRLSRTGQIDLVYIRSLHFALALILLGKLHNRKIVLEINGLFADELAMRRKILGRFARRAAEFLEVFAAKKAVAIRAVTPKIKDDLVRRGVDEGRIRVIGNGVNIEMFKPIDEKDTLLGLKERWGIKVDEQVVIYVGYFYPWQGVEYLIQAAPLIVERIPDTRFLIVGDGLMKQEYVTLAKKLNILDKFIFTGAVPYEEVPLFINASDVCVSPEGKDFRNVRVGGSSLKLYEYMACAKPVVVGNLEGNKENVVDSESGVVVEPANTAEMANAVIKLLRDEQLRKQMGERGRKATIENYSWRKVAEQVTEICQGVIKGGEHGRFR